MLSSRFLVVSFLYLFHVTSLVVADPRGGNQFCESVRTVTVLRTVTPNQPPPSSSPAKNGNPPPVVTQRPGNVHIGNGNSSTSGNPKPSSVTNKNGNTKPSSVSNKNGNTKPSSTTNKNGNPKPSSTTNKNGNTKPSSVSNKNNNTKTSSTVLPTATPPATTNSDQNNGDPATSLTLDPSVIQTIDGKAQGDGQIDSLVSTNNFINNCVGKTLTNGNQVKGGSCNPTPMGDIPSVDNMPSAKFNSPKNFDTIPANTPFDIALQVSNLNTGTFTNPTNAYFAAPQQLVNGIIKGHSHVTVQQMPSLDATGPLDPKVFSFFKGLNTVATNGVLTTTVTNGLPAGFYRISSIVAAANHQECLGPVAQRGSFNDAIYITVTDGQNSKDAPPSSPPVDSTSSTVLPTSVSSSVLSSSVSSPAVPTTSPTDSPNGGNEKDGKNNKTPPDASLPVSTSSIPPDVSSTTSLPSPTETGGKNDVSSSEPPVPTSTQGNDKTDTKDPAVPSSAVPPDSTPQGDNGQNYRRMHRRSRLA